MDENKKLPREFYNRDGLIVAKELLGKLLVRRTEEGVTKGRIVEVEAYMGAEDKAAHSYGNLRSQRTRIQYGEGGFAYIYLIYGMYNCLNIVANQKEIPHVALIRALEPVEGLELMQKRRNTDKLKLLCNGPGKLCQAMGITRELYGEDLCGNALYLEEAKPLSAKDIVKSKRINIDYAEEARDYLWRFTIRDDPFVSVPVKQKEQT